MKLLPNNKMAREILFLVDGGAIDYQKPHTHCTILSSLN